MVLPACTNYERWDISEWANSSGILVNGMTQCNHRVIVLQHKCIEPLGESRSDWSIFAALAARMGLAAPYAEGSNELEWVRRTFEGSDLPKAVSWREFLKKGYYVVPPPAAGAPKPVAYRWFAEGRPEGHARPAAAARRLRRQVRRGAADAVRQDRVRRRRA